MSGHDALHQNGSQSGGRADDRMARPRALIILAGTDGREHQHAGQTLLIDLVRPKRLAPQDGSGHVDLGMLAIELRSQALGRGWL